MSPLRRHADGSVSLSLHIQPGAKRTEFAGMHGDAIKLRLAAPAVDGKANACLVSFLAETFGCAARDVCLEQGSKSRSKRVRIRRGDDDALLRIAQMLQCPIELAE